MTGKGTQQRGKPAAAGAEADQEKGRPMLRIDPIGAFSPVRLEGLDGVAGQSCRYRLPSLHFRSTPVWAGAVGYTRESLPIFVLNAVSKLGGTWPTGAT